MKSDLEVMEKEIRFLEIHMLNNHYNKSMDYVKGYLHALNKLDLKIRILKGQNKDTLKNNLIKLVGEFILGLLIGTILGAILYPLFM
jgi:hypothetical protein